MCRCIRAAIGIPTINAGSPVWDFCTGLLKISALRILVFNKKCVFVLYILQLLTVNEKQVETPVYHEKEHADGNN